LNGIAVAKNPGRTLLFSPASIAIHDNGYVLRQIAKVDFIP
jgi:hypothetical protein